MCGELTTPVLAEEKKYTKPLTGHFANFRAPDGFNVGQKRRSSYFEARK